jgi:hypothetical protein
MAGMDRSTRTLVLAAVGGAALVFACAGPLSMTAGLLVVGLVVGWAAGSGAPGRRGLAVGVALGTTVAGLLAAWAWSRLEGGTLDPLDLYGRTLGPVAPLTLLLAAIAGWASARGEPAGPR